MLSNYDVPNPLLPVWGVPVSSGRDLATMMNRLFQDVETAFQRPLARPAAPRIQMRDGGDSMSLIVDVPGCQIADIDLGIEKDTLTLRVTPPKSKAPEGFTPLHLERSRAGGQWSFDLAYPVDVNAIIATLSQGRLEVKLPKAPEAVPRRIAVQAV